jgi:hypothetical protein
MSEHEPECWIVSHSNPLNGCICTELRACQKRLWKEPLLVVSRRAGWNDALIAAREAVAAVDVRKDTSYEMRMQALAVIEALREKP